MSQSNDETKIQGVPNRSSLYARLAKYTPRAIREAVKLLDSKNDNVKLGAIKLLLSKTVPDLKATELSGKDGAPINIKLIRDYLSTFAGDAQVSEGSSTGQDEVQSLDMAQTSKKDVNSTRKASTRGA